MGKTTNSLISAGNFALAGQVHVDSLRTMHATTSAQLELPESTKKSINSLIDEVEKLLEGKSQINCISLMPSARVYHRSEIHWGTDTQDTRHVSFIWRTPLGTHRRRDAEQARCSCPVIRRVDHWNANEQ